MGDTAGQKSTLSWVGKAADNPKPFGLTTKGSGPVTQEDLADFEQKMLKLMFEMSEKSAKEGSGPSSGGDT